VPNALLWALMAVIVGWFLGDLLATWLVLALGVCLIALWLAIRLFRRPVGRRVWLVSLVAALIVTVLDAYVASEFVGDYNDVTRYGNDGLGEAEWAVVFGLAMLGSVVVAVLSAWSMRPDTGISTPAG